MAILIESKTHTDEKNRWATTWLCFDDAVRLYGRPFALDVAAEPATAKVPRFYTSPDYFDSGRMSAFGVLGGESWRFNPMVKCVGIDALAHDWERDWWCNPPFDLKQEFLVHAAKQVANALPGMMLLPYEPLTDWWRDLVDPIATRVFEPDGRYPFYETDGVTKKTGVNFGSVFVEFGPNSRKPGDLLPRIPFKRLRSSRFKAERAMQLETLRMKHLCTKSLSNQWTT